MITLRPDQLAAVENLRAALKDNQSVLLRGPCGFGKTVVSAYLAAGATRKQRRVIFGVHRRELARQTAKTFDKFGIPYGYIMAGQYSNPLAYAQIASADTLRNRPAALGCDLFIPDECHLWGSGVREELIHTVYKAGAHIVPLTATPERGDGKGLKLVKSGDDLVAGIADAMIMGPSESWLIERGMLARYRVYAPVQPDLSKLHIRAGDYIVSELSDEFDKPSIIGDAATHYGRYANGRRMIGYCFSREHGRHMAEVFNANGIRAAFIDGETPDEERRKTIFAFATGAIRVLFNCQLFREGFDLSAQIGADVPIQAVGLYNPTTSLPLAVQMMMRGMRPQEGYSVILDHANIIREHGFPDDDREWSLDGRIKKYGAPGERAQPKCTCGRCFASFRPNAGAKCPYCGFEKDIHGRQIATIEGELLEVDPDLVRQARREEQDKINKMIREARGLLPLARVAIKLGRDEKWVFVTHKTRGNPNLAYGQAVKAMRDARKELEVTN